jgi:hypothetical protein
MASSSPGLLNRRSGLTLLVVVVLALIAGLIFFITSPKAASGNRSIGPDTVAYRYRFGGEIITQYLDGVAAITEYRHDNVVDEVVFNLKNGKDYVVNAPLIVDYTFSTRTAIEQRQIMDKVYYRYDPYLQGEKQQWHKEWIDEQYLKYVGRLPTDAEWLEALNELTRGVEHFQMERWIQYSPPAIRYFITTQFEALAGREPTEAEAQQYFERLAAGESFEVVGKDIQNSLLKSR